jgi:hypothetical protein
VHKNCGSVGDVSGDKPLLPVRGNSAWSAGAVHEFLSDTVLPLRVAGTLGGAPLICSLWYLYEDGCLWCATGPGTAMARALRSNPSCGFELAPNEPPYRGIRGQGIVTLDPIRGPELLVRLIRRYLGRVDTPFAEWLIGRSADEVALRIEPAWITAWDFTERMRDALGPGANG